MRRNQKFSVSARPSDWQEIGRRAKVANMTISDFVVACVLEDEDDMRLALSEAKQRDLPQPGEPDPSGSRGPACAAAGE